MLIKGTELDVAKRFDSQISLHQLMQFVKIIICYFGFSSPLFITPILPISAMTRVGEIEHKWPECLARKFYSGIIRGRDLNIKNKII